MVLLAAAILTFSHCSPAAAAAAIVLGDERTDEYLPLLNGKRIALFANHSAMVKGEHLLELLIRNGQRVTVLYTPEHGIRGDKAAGETIEDDTLIATVGHPLSPAKRRMHCAIAKPIRIGNDVWIGGNVTIMPGLTIGNNVVIAAGAVVTKDVPDNSLVAGIPAKKIRDLENDVCD